MPVIALTQEMGSLAKDVSLKLAEALGLAVMRNEVIEHVADRMQVSTSLIGRLRGGKAGLVERLTTDSRSVALYTAEELFALPTVAMWCCAAGVPPACCGRCRTWCACASRAR